MNSSQQNIVSLRRTSCQNQIDCAATEILSDICLGQENSDNELSTTEVFERGVQIST